MPNFDFDLLTIGAGSGGVRASRVAAGLGARGCIAEESYLGGTCVNVGCVPKKLMVYAMQFKEHFTDAAGFGWHCPPAQFDWAAFKRAKDTEIERLNDVYRHLLEDSGVKILEGRARLIDRHTVEIAGYRLTAKHILVATGSWPARLALPGGELALTSNDVFGLEALPDRIIVLGGGYIAVEFCGIFRGLGSQVILVHRRDTVLRGFDDDIRSAVTENLRHNGVELRMERTVERIEKDARGVRVRLSDGEPLISDVILSAVGRHPNTADLGLEAAGVELDDRGAIKVDEGYRTSVDNIYAVGDVIDRLKLTPVAIAEGTVLAHDLFGGGAGKICYENIPTALFSNPPVGTVGLTETQARDRLGSVRVYFSTFRPLKQTLSGRQSQTMMKLVVDGSSDRVVGCHMVGEDAPEIVQGLAIALNCGATKAQFDATIGIHPTAAEEFVTMREPRPDPSTSAGMDSLTGR